MPLVMTYPKILVTDADSTKALAVVRALGREFEVYTTCGYRMGLASWSRHTKKNFVYNSNIPKEFPAWVVKVCCKNNIRIVITPEETSSFLLARESTLFSKHNILLTTPPIKALTIAMDKWLTVNAAQAVGVPVPLTKIPRSVEHAIQIAKEIGYPIVVKPRYSHYWYDDRFFSTNGVLYANSNDRLVEILQSQPKEIPAPLLQRFIPGKGMGIFLLLNTKGELCAEFAHERLRDLRPTGSGSVLRRSVAIDNKLREWSLNLLRYIDYCGVAMVEFRQDKNTDEIYLMEINGRFWGSLQLATDAGVNFPRMLVDVALKRPIQMPSYRTNVILRWWIGDLARTLSIMKGRPNGFAGTFPSRWEGIKTFIGPQPRGTMNEIFRFADPLPALGEMVSYFRRIWWKR